MSGSRSTVDLSSSSSAPGFHVFSIRPAAGELEPDANTRQYTTRRSHTKSRLGCSPCKTKRVKCDEKRPRCGRCERTNNPCGYSTSLTVNQKTSKCSEEPGENAAAPHGPSLAISIPKPLEKLDRDTHLLKHYDRITGLGKDTVTCSDVLVGAQSRSYRMKVLQIAQEHPYLLHAILAVAALHFNHHDVEGFRFAKLSHLQVALSDFQNAISKPVCKGESDAILLTSMMINMQYFSWIDSLEPKDSWVFSEEPSRLDWLSVQMGLTPLINGTRQYHAESLLLPIWVCSAYDEDETQGLPKQLLHLCGISASTTEAERRRNPYLGALQLLGPLMLEERCSRSLVKYMRFLSSLPKPFFALLQTNDHLALLILSYWFALVSYVGFWWVEKRVKRDCTAICMYLDAHGDAALRPLLVFPASACRYRLTTETIDLELLELGEAGVDDNSSKSIQIQSGAVRDQDTLHRTMS